MKSIYILGAVLCLFPSTASWASSPLRPVAVEFDQVTYAKVDADGSVVMPLVLVIAQQGDVSSVALRRTIRKNDTVLAEITEKNPHISNGLTQDSGHASTYSPATALAMSALLPEGTYVDRVEATVKVDGASGTMTVRKERFFELSRGVITPLKREQYSAGLIPVESGFDKEGAPVIRLVGDTGELRSAPNNRRARRRFAVRFEAERASDSPLPEPWTGDISEKEIE